MINRLLLYVLFIVFYLFFDLRGRPSPYPYVANIYQDEHLISNMQVVSWLRISDFQTAFFSQA